MPYTIQYTLPQLKILNSLHGDLHVNIYGLDNVFTISAQDRDTFNVPSNNTYEDFITEFKANLAHYPNSVTINEQPLETTQYPALAHATLTSYSTDYERSHSFRLISLEPHTDHAAKYNAYAGGVLTHIPGLTQKETTYYTPGHQPMPHWQRADKVQLHPHTVLSPQDVDKLTDDDLNLIKSLPPYRYWNPMGHPEAKQLPAHITNFILDWQHTARAQVVRTLEHPNTPTKYEGHVFNHVIVPPHEDLVPYSEGSPLIAHRTPLLMEYPHDNRPDYISVAHALYQEDHGIVPVAFTREQNNNPPHHLAITDYHFTHTLTEPKQDDWCIKTVNQVALDLHLDNDEEDHLIITAPFHLAGNTWNKAIYIPSTLKDSDTLAEKMTYAYWDLDTHNSNGDTKDNFENLVDEMSRLVTAALGNPSKAFQQQLQNYAHRFHTDLPWPKEEISAHSHNGRITVIYRPKDN